MPSHPHQELLAIRATTAALLQNGRPGRVLGERVESVPRVSTWQLILALVASDTSPVLSYLTRCLEVDFGHCDTALCSD